MHVVLLYFIIFHIFVLPLIYSRPVNGFESCTCRQRHFCLTSVGSKRVFQWFLYNWTPSNQELLTSFHIQRATHLLSWLCTSFSIMECLTGFYCSVFWQFVTLTVVLMFIHQTSTLYKMFILETYSADS